MVFVTQHAPSSISNSTGDAGDAGDVGCTFAAVGSPPEELSANASGGGGLGWRVVSEGTIAAAGGMEEVAEVAFIVVLFGTPLAFAAMVLAGTSAGTVGASAASRFADSIPYFFTISEILKFKFRVEKRGNTRSTKGYVWSPHPCNLQTPPRLVGTCPSCYSVSAPCGVGNTE